MSSAEVPRKLHRWHARQEANLLAKRSREVVHEDCVGVQKKLYKLGKISTPGETSEKRKKKKTIEEVLDITLLWLLALYQVAQCWEVEKTQSCTRLAKVENRGETKVIDAVW